MHFNEIDDESGEAHASGYLAVRASGRSTRMVRVGPTILEVPHLLSDGTLGLELQETTVTHVKDEVKMFGWKYGDKIVEVNGFPVKTFEALWTRFLGSRNRLPIKFGILRKEFHVHTNLPEERPESVKGAEFVNAKPAKPASDEEQGRAQKIAIDPLNERADFLRVTSEMDRLQMDQTGNTFFSASSNSMGAPSHARKSEKHRDRGPPPPTKAQRTMGKQASDFQFDDGPVRHDKVEFVKDAYGRPVAVSYPRR